MKAHNRPIAQPSLLQTAASRILRNLLLTNARFQKAIARVDHFAAGMALSGLTPEQLTELTVSLYAGKDDCRTGGLHNWEVKWFEKDLPKPPKKVLLGGAGAGPEVEFLKDRQYQVVAFEPAAAPLNRSRRQIGDHPDSLVLGGTYEDLVAPQTDRARDFQRQVESLAPFDVVMLGWASFTHIGLESNRVALLKKIQTLCPSGRLLMSFWMRDEGTGTPGNPSFRLGQRIGKLLRARIGDFVDPPHPRAGDSIDSIAGFGHSFTENEIRELAESTGYGFVRPIENKQAGWYPHVTLEPKRK